MPPRKRQQQSSYTFTCQRYPQLVVSSLGVEFVNGRLETGDADTAKALRNMPEHFGIQEEGRSHERTEQPDQSEQSGRGDGDAVSSRTTRRADRG